MAVYNEGYNFKLYLEGIKTPFIGASLQFSHMISMATVEMYPHKLFKNIPSGTLAHIFFRRKGIEEPYQLIYSGVVAGKVLNTDSGNRGYSLILYGRAAIFNNITLAEVMPSDIVSSTNKAFSRRTTVGTGAIEALERLPGDFMDVEGGTRPFADRTPVPAVMDPEAEQTVNDDVPGDSSPAAEIGKMLSISNPDMLKQTLSKICTEAVGSSGQFYNVAYHHRLILDKLFNEMPPTWANYIASWGQTGTGLNIKLFRDNMSTLIESSLGGASNLTHLINVILQTFHAEIWEIPGFAKHSCLITPDLILSDVPACNMIFMSESLSVSFSDNDANKITRVMTRAQPRQHRGDYMQAQMPNEHIVSYLKMYPDVMSIKADEEDDNKRIRAVQQALLEGEQYIGSRLTITGFPPDYLLTSMSMQTHWDLTEHFYHKIKNQHRYLQISGAFMPNLIPGQRAIIMDKNAPLLFKIESLSHRISNTGAISTSIKGGQAEYLDVETFHRPHWYDVAYDKAKISEVYESYFGCRSMSALLNSPGNVSKAFDEAMGRYESSEIKQYMSEQFTKRHFDTESDTFGMFVGLSAAQQDADGVLIYQADAFGPMRFTENCYRLSGSEVVEVPEGLTNDRQGPILDYVKTIYGVIGDTHE